MNFRKLWAPVACVLFLTTNGIAQDDVDHSGIFDRFEGDWVLHTFYLQADGTRHEQDARLHVRRLESDQEPIFMFEERHESLDNSGLFIGRMMYAYHSKSNRWRGTGVNTLANRKWRDVTVSGSDIVYVESGELFNGRAGKNRSTYFNITENSFEVRSEHSADGENWSPSSYGLIAERIQND